MNEAHELLRRALEALETTKYFDKLFISKTEGIEADIRTYLANQETAKDEAVGWIDMTDKELKEMHVEEQFGLFCDADEFVDIARVVIAKFKYQNRTRPSPEAEPVAYINLDEKRLEWAVPFEFKSSAFKQGKLPLYTRPAEPKSKPMTEEPIAYINLDEQRLEFAKPFQFNRSAFKQGKIPLFYRITEDHND